MTSKGIWTAEARLSAWDEVGDAQVTASLSAGAAVRWTVARYPLRARLPHAGRFGGYHDE